MLCRKNSSCIEKGTVPVYLNVYDLTPMNGYAYWLGLGVYHSGVQVHGVEYAFGAHEYPTTGIFEGEPRQCEGFTFRKSILIGKTDLGVADVRTVMEELAESYKGNAYNLITKNCNHFCNDACIKLTGNPIPSWVNRLARLGFICNCVLPANFNVARIPSNRVGQEKPCEASEAEKRKLATGPKRVVASSSASSSPAPSSPAQVRRGRSRTRRALPPSSPLIIGTSSA